MMSAGILLPAGDGFPRWSSHEVCIPDRYCRAFGGHMHSASSGMCQQQLQHHTYA